MKRTLRFAPIALSLIVTIPPIHAQDPEITTLKVGASVVAVPAIVRDKAGLPVPNLTRDAFTLKQDGKPQPITYFSQGSDLPLTLALMVDTSGSQTRFILDEVTASKAFFPAMMKRPEDRAVLIQFDSGVIQLAKITSSVTTLQHAVAYLLQPHDDIPGSGGPNGTLLYDAIVDVSKIEFSNQLGRRAMVILTDGGDNGSHSNEKKAIEEAQRADIMIYSVYYSNGGGNIDTLNKLSRATGGRVFTVSPKMNLAQIYSAIADDLRQQYEIGYRPPDTRPNRYHKIQLTTKDPHLIVQSREGYFTPK